jgi:AraC-like DNA-binding protein
MSPDILHVKSISQVHEAFGFDKPTHPLISIIDVSELEFGEEFVGMKYSSDLYAIAMKDASCGMQYGRNTYDFAEGVLIFTGPNQVVTSTQAQAKGSVHGWMIFFHPDLIRNTHLGEIIDQYSFFSYDVHEALHLSEQEQDTITDCIHKIEEETRGRIDNMSQRVIVSNLELLLNYCMRFYERQFNTRTATHKDTISKVNDYLKAYFKDGQLTEFGVPSIQNIADSVNLSASYLSDLLKKETGRSAKDHINEFLVDKAKDMLLSTQQSVSEIAYNLGFNYPHYFSRLFKAKTGITPNDYRSLN